MYPGFDDDAATADKRPLVSAASLLIRQDARVRVDPDADGPVAEHLADDSNMDGRQKQQSGCRLPQVVKPDIVDELTEEALSIEPLSDASPAAIRTVRRGKREALCHAVLDSALPEASEQAQPSMFVRGGSPRRTHREKNCFQPQ